MVSSRKKICICLGAAVFSILAIVMASVSFMSRPVQASSDDEIMKKALAGAMEMCYRNRSSAFVSPIDTSSYFFVETAVKPWGTYYMPTNIGNEMGTTPINCQEVFLGVKGGPLNLSTKLQGILSRFGKDPNATTPENLGYVKNTDGSASSQGYSCVYLKYHLFSTMSDYTEKTSNKVCFPTDSSGKFSIDNPQNVKLEDETNITEELGSLKLDYNSSMDCIHYSAMNPPEGETWGQGTGYGCFAWGVDGKTPSEVQQAMNEGASNIAANKGFPGTKDYVSIYQAYEDAHRPTAYQATSQSILSSSMVLNDTSSRRTMDWLKGGTDGYTGMTFGPNDWAYIYTAYIKRLRESAQISVNNDCVADKDKYEYAVTPDNGATWCEVSGVESVTEQFAGQSGGSNKILELMSFADILRKYKALNFNAVDSGTTSGVVGNDPNSGVENNEQTTPNCFNSAGSLGWIICPVLEGLSTIVSGIYDSIIVPNFLQIDASFVETGSSVYGGWQDFRNYANIIFVILFVIVILAQITGIGINNYNIKKILPRLIMIVVLVNISFILCQLAVDLSNILGFGLEKFFTNLSQNTTVTVGDFASNLIVGLFSTVATGGVIAGAVVASAVTWEFWIIPLVLFLIGIVISIFFFAIILGVRKAGIIILIVLAPVAIVCYALPNTKRFFDRWLKMFSSLLIVFPICGALMGGGQYASTLLLGAAGGDDVGFFMALVAMLIQVVPFFLIPSLVKGSLTAMGSIGAKIAGFGDRISGGLQRGIRNSEGVKETERSLNMRNAARSFNKLDRRVNKRLRSGKEVSPSLLHRRSNAAARYNRMAYEDIRAGGTQELLTPGSTARGLAEQKELTKQMNDDIAAQESIYTNDSQFADEQILGNEYEDVLAQFAAAPRNRVLEVKVKALQNVLSETDAGRRQVQNRMTSVLARNSANLTDGEETGLSKAAAHLMSGKLGVTYKAKNRGMFSMIGDLSRKQYGMGTQEMRDSSGAVITDPTSGQARRHSFQRVVTGTDTSGRDIFDYQSSYYDKNGLGSYTEETLAGADEGAIDHILAGINNGNISGRDLSTIAQTASGALNNSNINVQPKIAEKLRQMERAGFAGSKELIANASDASLGDVVSRIGSSEISGNELASIAENAKLALTDPAALHSQGTVERLNQILTAAGAHGAVDAATGANFEAVDPTSIKVRGAKAPEPPKQIAELAYPGGVTRSTNAIHTPGRPRRTEVVWKDSAGHQITDQKLIEQAEEVYRLNQKIREQNALNGFGPGQSGSNP